MLESAIYCDCLTTFIVFIQKMHSPICIMVPAHLFANFVKIWIILKARYLGKWAWGRGLNWEIVLVQEYLCTVRVSRKFENLHFFHCQPYSLWWTPCTKSYIHVRCPWWSSRLGVIQCVRLLWTLWDQQSSLLVNVLRSQDFRKPRLKIAG